MPVKITKTFQWSPNGYDVATVDAGEYESLPDRASEIAVQLGAVEGEAVQPSTTPVVGAPEVKAGRRRNRAAEPENG